MTGTKPLLASKAVWGGLLALLGGGGLPVAGYIITGDDINEALQLVQTILAAVGGILAVWGRITATKEIG